LLAKGEEKRDLVIDGKIILKETNSMEPSPS
jgi:hypothetical protein